MSIKSSITHKFQDAWRLGDFTLRGIQQHRNAVNGLLGNLDNKLNKDSLSERAGVQLNPVISRLYNLNQASTKALEQIALRATAKVSLSDEKNFNELQNLAKEYQGLLKGIVSNRIDIMVDDNPKNPNHKSQLKAFSDLAINSLNQLGGSELRTGAFQGQTLEILEHSFKDPKKLEDIFNPVRIISESYSLYNQLLKATKQALDVSEATHEKSAKEIISYLKEDKDMKAPEIKQLLEDLVKTSLIFTSHPTPGVPTDRRVHLDEISETLKNYFMNSKPRGSVLEARSERGGIKDHLEALVKSPLFNDKAITPLDETKYLIENLKQLMKQLPRFVIALENAYQASFPNEKNNVLSLSNILNIRKWTTTDADGNPNNNLSEYLRSFTEKKLILLEAYQSGLQELMKGYTESFSTGVKIHHNPLETNSSAAKNPSGNLEGDRDFISLYKGFVQESGRDDAYRALMENFKLTKHDKPLINVLEDNIIELKTIRKDLEKLNGNASEEELKAVRERLSVLAENFSIKDFLEPLRAIEKNKRYSFENSQNPYYEGIPDGYNTRAFIKAIKIFGDSFGAADIRQGADYVSEAAKVFEANTGLTDYAIDKPKLRERVLQTNDLLESVKLGEISRLILSMTKSSEDVLNALNLSEKKGHFKSANFNPETNQWQLPKTGLEIVPLTELIPDLDKAYKETSIKPLSDPKFRQYLIANDGVLTKMYGPSDSGKWSGPFPSWSGMLKAQYFDSRVVEVFNDFLKDKLSSGNTEAAYQKWSSHVQYLESFKNPEFKEITVVKEALSAFQKSFKEMTGDELSLWQQAQQEKPSLRDGVKYKIIDGFGGPVIRGNGADGRLGVSPTTTNGFLYEQTVQGSEVDKLRQPANAIEFITKRLKIAIKNAGDKFKSSAVINSPTVPVTVDPHFFKFLDDTSDTLRKSLREGIIGIDYQDDEKLAQANPEKLRNYIKMIALTTPALFLGLYNNSSRPITRSGEQISSLLAKSNNDVVKMVENLEDKDLLKILNDMRAIPIAAFYNLGGSAHISIGGVSGLNDKQREDFVNYYQNSRKAQSWSEKIVSNFMTDIVNSWEKELFKITPQLMEYAAKTNYEALSKQKNSYNPANDEILVKTKNDYQSLMNLIAKAKKYSVSNPEAVKLEELMQDNPLERQRLLAQRQNLDPLKKSISMASAAIFRETQSTEQKTNPYQEANIPLSLKRAFNSLVTAISSNDGAIDY